MAKVQKALPIKDVATIPLRRRMAFCLMDYGADAGDPLLNELLIIFKEHIEGVPLSVCTERKPENITEDEFIKMHLIGVKEDIITSLGFKEA